VSVVPGCGDGEARQVSRAIRPVGVEQRVGEGPVEDARDASSCSMHDLRRCARAPSAVSWGSAMARAPLRQSCWNQRLEPITEAHDGEPGAIAASVLRVR
jgi:hypothetical protein